MKGLPLPKGEIEFVRIVLSLTNNRDDIIFSEEHFQVTTDSGEVFKEPYTLLSSLMDLGYRGSGDYNMIATYLLEKSQAEEMQKITFYVVFAPTDEKGDPLGEDISIDINF